MHRKVADFGVTIEATSTHTHTSRIESYLAPELLVDGKRQYNNKEWRETRECERSSSGQSGAMEQWSCRRDRVSGGRRETGVRDISGSGGFLGSEARDGYPPGHYVPTSGILFLFF